MTHIAREGDRHMARPKARELADLSDLAQPGAEIAVRVTPRSAYNAVVRRGDVIKVLVTTVPEGGKATAIPDWIVEKYSV